MMTHSAFGAIVLACCPFVCRAEPALRHELTSTLASMSAAAIAGDAEAYLEHIATDEPEFLVEQRAWAKDIRRIAPTELRYELRSEPKLDEEGDATAVLRVTWDTPNWPRAARTIEYPARFVQQDGAWRYGGRDWSELDAEGLRVLHADGLRPQAEAAVAFWPEVKAHVEAGFETELDHPQVVKMYTSMEELQFTIFPAYAEPLGGWNEPGESIKLIAGDFGPGYLKTVLAHEYGHALTFAMGGPDIPAAIERAHAMPWWLLEGTAELASMRFSGGWGATSRRVIAWHREGRLIAWDRITNFYETDPADYGYVYSMGKHMVGYLSDRFGRTQRNEWLRAMMQGQTLDEASMSVLGVPFERLDADWRAWVAEQAERAEGD